MGQKIGLQKTKQSIKIIHIKDSKRLDFSPKIVFKKL